jgi:hypothetical protein
MLTLLFLALPLLAVAYSLGGVSSGMLYFSAVRLFLTCLAVGAMGLYCSAYQASTFQALMHCWVLCLVFAMCCSLSPVSSLFTEIVMGAGFRPPNSGYYPGYRLGTDIFYFAAPTLFMSFFYLVTTVLFLLAAKSNLEKRAFVQRRNPFGQQFKHLDQYWKDVRKIVRALLRKRDEEANALAAQVVERGLDAMGAGRGWSLSGYLFAKMQVPNVLAFALIFGVIALIALVANVVLDPKSGGAFQFFVGALWILALLTVPIQSANAVASERINERLGPILTTPLTGPEMLREWLQPLERWIQFLVRPLAIIVAVEALVKFNTQDHGAPRFEIVGWYAAISGLTLWIYPGLTKWLCLWIGLRLHNQIRALMTSLLVTVAWCALPLLASGYLTQTGLMSREAGTMLNFASPVTVINLAEQLGRRGAEVTPDLVGLAATQLAVCALLMWLMRQICLAGADRHLGRI